MDINQSDLITIVECVEDSEGFIDLLGRLAEKGIFVIDNINY
jgi:hypothetical protein